MTTDDRSDCDPGLPTDDGVGAAAVLVHRVGYEETEAVLLDAAAGGRSVRSEAIRHGAATGRR